MVLHQIVASVNATFPMETFCDNRTIDNVRHFPIHLLTGQTDRPDYATQRENRNDNKNKNRKNEKSCEVAFGLTLGIFLAVIPAQTTRGQAVGTTHVGNAKVTQGDNMSMDVTLDKASNLAGSISVIAFPDGTVNAGVDLSCGLEPGRTTCTVSNRMPLDAKLGKWVISRITFTPISGVAKVLSDRGDSAFEVVAHGGIVLPDSATVSDIK